MNQATEKGNGIDLRPEWGIFIPSVLVIILISIPAVLYPKAAEEVVSAIYQPFAANRGGRGGHVLVDHRASVGPRAATAIRSAHEHAGL